MVACRIEGGADRLNVVRSNLPQAAAQPLTQVSEPVIRGGDFYFDSAASALIEICDLPAPKRPLPPWDPQAFSSTGHIDPSFQENQSATNNSKFVQASFCRGGRCHNVRGPGLVAQGL